ncbi:hypothetical protein [Chitinophaga sp. Cy-1792]|uniref:hypothetical protein n=1 Tax=Chitinophaga sp. Cy-1792 TaxID=2608339 RepID=UPI0014235E9E|nr:hypothetical protein [Chitinophaga sp. Cy-1792]NIG56904.1 hypothetical protein [Chitinophaga sp. Cy-1792]
MKKYMLIGAALSVVFFACSKKDSDKPTGPIDPTVPTDTLPATKTYDASALTAASVASRGTIVKGALPAASAATGTPVLSSTIAEDTYSAIAGRYLIIPLTLTSGQITGAYVQFQGADAYFKVDFSSKTNGRVANPRPVFGRDIYGDGRDSAVVIKMPADLPTSTLKVLISVYDKAGNASKSITVNANVFNTASSADSKALSGKWSLVRTQYIDKYTNLPFDWEYPYVNHYRYGFYTCINGKLSETDDSTVTGAVKIMRSNWKTNEEYTQLNADGSGKHVYSDSLYVLKADNTCSSRNYEASNDTGNEALGWYYNATTKKLYIISDVIIYDTKDFSVEVYDAKVENGKLIITGEGGDITELEKK